MKPIYMLLIVIQSLFRTNYAQEITDEIILYSNESTFILKVMQQFYGLIMTVRQTHHQTQQKIMDLINLERTG